MAGARRRRAVHPGGAVRGTPAAAQAGAPAAPVVTPTTRTRTMRIVAQDPSVRGADGRILTAEVEVPAEELAPGPRGYRVHVIDYDASSGKLYPPLVYAPGARNWTHDPAGPVDDRVILEDPGFHAQNTYAVVMRTLARFELALGRRVSWGFDDPGHQIKVAPHAFSDANAFYSRRDEALLFGHFPARATGREPPRTVFTCLSHDVLAHETAHAILDGLRRRYMEPSSPDQAAFHEGFADVVALLSVFALPEAVRALVDIHLGPENGPASRLLRRRDVQRKALAASVLMGVAKQFGKEVGPIGRSALRHSASLVPSPDYLDAAKHPDFLEPHVRGEVLVAAVMNAFLSVWAERLTALLADPLTRYVDRVRAAEEGSAAADYLLTMAIRAIDYCPPVHLRFGTFLSAMLTADHEIRPKDALGFRRHLVSEFARFGVAPAAIGASATEWSRPPTVFSYDRARFDSMQHDPDEVFRFVWENRAALRLHDGAYTRVISVRPCLRLAPDDGFPLHETVAEVLQQLTLTAGELQDHGIGKPADMPDQATVMLLGGVTLVFDEYGQVKYAIGDNVFDAARPPVQRAQTERIASLWERGFFRKGASAARRFAAIHRNRGLDAVTLAKEQW